MLLKMQNALLPEDLATIRAAVESAQLVDGSVSGKSTLKQNLQSPQGNPGLQEATAKIVQSLITRKEFQTYALPRQFNVVFNR